MELEFIIQNWHLFVALVVIVLLLSFDSARRRFGGVKQVTASDLPRLINHEDAVVIDVRESAEYRKGHIPGAVNVPLSQLGDDSAKLARYRKSGVPVVVACQSGTRAGRAASVLRKLEFEKVYTLSGGMGGWTKENLPVEK